MSSQSTSTKDKVKSFLARYGYLMLVVVGILSFIIAIAVLATNQNSDAGQVNVNANKASFCLPVADATIGKNYSDKYLQYNATLNQWEVHKAIDFCAPLGANVCSVYTGKVTDIYTNYLEGTVIVIDHGNNLTAKYGSLDEEVKVKVGDTVTSGQIIGAVASSAKSEMSDSAHLHFEMLENDKKIDPAAYLNISNK